MGVKFYIWHFDIYANAASLQFYHLCETNSQDNYRGGCTVARHSFSLGG